MILHRHAAVTILVSIGILLVEVGCSSSDQPTLPSVPTHAAKGQVQYDDGSTVVGGMIELTPLNGGVPVRAAIDANGMFTLSTIQDNGSITEGAKAGKYRVTVTPTMSDKRQETGIVSSEELTISEGQNEISLKVTKPR